MTFRASGCRLLAPGVVLAALVAGVVATSPTSQAQAPAPDGPTNTAPNPGEMDQPHALAMDSAGRLFVGDRGNNRVLIFD